MYSALVRCIVNVFMSGSPIFLMPIQLRRACSAGQGLRKMIAPAVHTLLQGKTIEKQLTPETGKPYPSYPLYFHSFP